MGDSKKHHFVPRFLLKPWTKNDNKLWLYLKRDMKNSPKYVSIADVGHEKNLYTSTNGDKSVESDFFGVIDSDASNVHKKILGNNELNLDTKEKESFTHFINTLHIRSPGLINSIKDFNESSRILGLDFAKRHLKETGEDLRKNYEKRKYDDTPKLVSIFSTIGGQTAMSRSYEDDFNKVMSSKWMILKNTSVYNLITCDSPLEIIQFSTGNSWLTELPNIFGMILPLSPNRCLIISNNDNFLKNLKLVPQKELIKRINISTILRANNQILTQENSLNNFIQRILNDY